MGRDKEIVIYEGLAHPVLCNKIRYYKDSYFTKRLLDKVEVKPLELHGDKRMKGRTATLVAASTLALLSACSSPQVQPAEPAPDPDSYFKSEAAEAADQAEAAADAQEAADRAAHPESYTPLPPGPAAGFPPAPTMPPMSASAFRSDILRLLESIQSIGDTQRPNVEAVMRAKMGNPGTDTYFLYYGSVHEGWDYGVDVYPDRANLTAEITFHLYFRGAHYRADPPTLHLRQGRVPRRVEGSRMDDRRACCGGANGASLHDLRQRPACTRHSNRRPLVLPSARRRRFIPESMRHHGDHQCRSHRE